MTEFQRKLQCFFALTSYFLSSLIIFNPLYSSKHPALSLISAFVTGFLLITLITAIANLKKRFDFSSKLLKPVSLICGILSMLLSLVLLTEVIKDTSYVANKGVSMLYYTFLSLFVLLVSFYLCSTGHKGIFRFSIIGVIPFILLLILTFSIFFTTKGIITNAFSANTTKDFSDLLTGVKTAVFMSLDTIIFIFCFEKYSRNTDGNLYKKVFLLSYCISFFVYAIIFTILLLTFGSTILSQLEYPIYALLKLVPGFDVTELLSTVEILGYMIKSSVYIYSSSLCIKTALFPRKKGIRKIITILHSIIPIILLLVIIFGKKLGYGAFQHTVYIINLILSISFIIVLFNKKKT